MMAADIIDLTSDAEDESPTKLFKSCQSRKQTRQAEQLAKSKPRVTNGNAHTNTTAARNGYTPSHSVSTATPASTNGFLSESAQAALGEPGRRLSIEVDGIEQQLRDRIQQSEAQRQERVATAGRFQQGRAVDNTALDHVRANFSTPTASAYSKSRNSTSKNKAKQERRSSLTGQQSLSGVHDRPSAQVLSGPGVVVHRLEQPWQLQHTTSTNDFKRTFSRVLDEASQVPAAKRPRIDGLDAGVAQQEVFSAPSMPEAQRQQPDFRQPLSEPKYVLKDVTDNHFERISHSDEPEMLPRRFAEPANADLTKSVAPRLHNVTPYRPQTATPQATPTSGSKFGREYTEEEDALLKRLKEVDKVKWSDMANYFEGRTYASLQTRYSSKLKSPKLTITPPTAAPAATSRPATATATATASAQAAPIKRAYDEAAASAKVPASVPNVSTFGGRYSAEDDALIRKLKEVDKLSFEDMVPYFPGRNANSLSVHWYTKVRNLDTSSSREHRFKTLQRTDSQEEIGQSRVKRQRRSGMAATDGFVSWDTAKSMMRSGIEIESSRADEESNCASDLTPFHREDQALPKSVSHILRQRELGSTTGARSWTSSRCLIPDELKNQAFKEYALQRYYHGTSGDVVGLSWSASGKYFAAGSIAITDAQSQQYNMSRNLLLGDREHGELQELPHHHVPRPLVNEADNVNALHSMRRSQDSRLFLTVTSTAFSPVQGKEHWLFTTGNDKMLRRYSIDHLSSQQGSGIQRTKCKYAIEHSAPVELLAMHQDGLVATGCHAASNSIKVYDCGSRRYGCKFSGSPNRSDLQSSAAIFPSALKWGEHYWHRRYLLAGFCGDEDKQLAGETALWDVEHEHRESILGTTRNVFDVAWNPCPSSASVAFAVASNSSSINLGKGMRTAIQCFAPTESGMKRVIAWQCPALDINDLVFCPHDDNLIAAGATNGKVFIWDKRWVDQHQRPWHTLCHEESLNVLGHDRDREETDTGVRYLSWGTTKTRLYSGSSDGIVKVWNPYRAEGNAHIEDISVPRQDRSAIMSGAFSPDYRELLIGTENGRINLFQVGGGAVHRSSTFKLHTAPGPVLEEDTSSDLTNALVDSGKIEIRPCGAMPFRQAVQGKNYRGPYLAPTAEELSQADERLREAQDTQNEIEIKIAEQGLNLIEDNSLVKAQARVRDAQHAIEDLQDRLDFESSSRPKAEDFQTSLMAAEQEYRAIEKKAIERYGKKPTCCTLPCTHFPNPEGIIDSSRSELRVPGRLLSVTKEALSTARLRTEDIVDGCYLCDPRKPGPRNGKADKCLNCALKQIGLSTECSICAAPARVEAEVGKLPLCERCNFACFRCSDPVRFSESNSLVICDACGITWEPGVLGYEIVDFPKRDVVLNHRNMELDSREDGDDLGISERDRLASRFEVEKDEDFIW